MAQCPNGVPGGIELVRNGDFEQGNTGFASDYEYVTDEVRDENQYTVIDDASKVHSEFQGRDHTTGAGNLMVVNGAGTPNSSVWCQEIKVKPGATYVFSLWVTTLFYADPAILQFSINGKNVSDTFSAPSTVGDWRQFYTTWDSGTDTVATICIVNQNLVPWGNDFGLDDISFKACACGVSPDAGKDTTICLGQRLTLQASGADTYHWLNHPSLSDTSISNPTVTPLQTTTYYLIARQDTCSAIDSVTVSVDIPPVAFAGRDTIICRGEQVLLQGSGGSSYLWQTEADTAALSIEQTLAVSPQFTASYIVTVRNGVCTGSDTVTVFVNPLPSVSITGDTLLCIDSTGSLTAAGADSVVWSTGERSRTIFVTLSEPTTFSVTAYSGGCEASASVRVRVEDCREPEAEEESYLWFPTAFSPNTDDVNDVFGYVHGGIGRIMVLVYNRWGEELFRSQRLGEFWDGTFRGETVQEGVYLYIASAMGDDGKRYYLSGTVTLIR